MENTFYVVNEIYTHENDNYDDSIILSYYTQNKNDFLRYLELELGIYLEDEYDGSYRYINGYEIFKTDVNELLEYIYEYPINFTDRFRDKLKIKEDENYDLTIAYYFCLLRDKIEYITSIKYGENYDIIDIDNDILIECEQGYFLYYLIHFIQRAFDKKDLSLINNSIIESYTE